MAVLHPNIVSFVKAMKSTSYWYADDEPKTLWNRVKRIYLHCRLVLLVVLLVENAVGLYYLEDFGLTDGSFIYLPICLFLVVVNGLAFNSRKDLDRLVATLNRHFMTSHEPWMRNISNKYTTSLWRYMKYLFMYDKMVKLLYVATPFAADCVLHYGFDLLEKPFYLPSFVSPWMPHNVTWGPQYYTVMVLSWWCIYEALDGIFGFMVYFSCLATYVYIQMVIFKEKVKAAKFNGSKEEVDAEFRTLVAWHNDNIQLNRDLKAVLGLPCAFQSQILSLSLTLSVFTSVTSTVIPVKIAYSSGCVFYTSSGLLYSTLGQRLENVSNEIFYALYDLPWYKCAPPVRKNLNMMMRQSHTPLVIDYHGRSKMNLANFMQILRQSYSYFTLLRSVTADSN